MGTRIEQCGCGVNARAVRHSMIRFGRSFNISTMNTQGHTHVQILWGLYYDIFDLHEVPLFQCLDTKISKKEISLRVDNIVD